MSSRTTIIDKFCVNTKVNVFSVQLTVFFSSQIRKGDVMFSTVQCQHCLLSRHPPQLTTIQRGQTDGMSGDLCATICTVKIMLYTKYCCTQDSAVLVYKVFDVQRISCCVRDNK